MIPRPAKNNMKVKESTDAALCLLMEDRRHERSFISVRNKIDILLISLFMMTICDADGKDTRYFYEDWQVKSKD